MPFRNFYENVYTLKCNNFNTGIVATTYYPASASFIDVSNFDHCAFLIQMGTTTSELTFQVMQDTSATATGSITALVGAVIVIAAADGNKWALIEFNPARLTAGFRYVSLYNTGAAGGDDYACITFLGYRARHLPVTQPANFANTAATNPVQIFG